MRLYVGSNSPIRSINLMNSKGTCDYGASSGYIELDMRVAGIPPHICEWLEEQYRSFSSIAHEQLYELSYLIALQQASKETASSMEKGK